LTLSIGSANFEVMQLDTSCKGGVTLIMKYESVMIRAGLTREALTASWLVYCKCAIWWWLLLIFVGRLAILIAEPMSLDLRRHVQERWKAWRQMQPHPEEGSWPVLGQCTAKVLWYWGCPRLICLPSFICLCAPESDQMLGKWVCSVCMWWGFFFLWASCGEDSLQVAISQRHLRFSACPVGHYREFATSTEAW